MCGGEIVDEKWKFSLEGVLRGTVSGPSVAVHARFDDHIRTGGTCAGRSARGRHGSIYQVSFLDDIRSQAGSGQYPPTMCRRACRPDRTTTY